MNSLLIAGGLILLGMATFNITFPRLSTLAGGLLLICLAQYGAPLLASLH